jgi:hypothetical protein
VFQGFQLCRGEIVLFAFRIDQYHRNEALVLPPVIDDAHAAAFAAPLRSPADFAKTTRTTDEVACLRVPREVLLKSGVAVVIEQFEHTAGESGRFFENHTRQATPLADVVNSEFAMRFISSSREKCSQSRMP